jgi:SH3-like domain-containing protein
MGVAGRIGLILLITVAAMPVRAALEFRSVGETPAVLYDGPSIKANKVFVASRGSPMEVVSTLEGWVKVREPGGQLAWVEAGALVAKRTVSVSAALAPVRAAPAEASPPVFQAQQGVILELIEASGAWAHVRHRDGLTGYVRASQVWGL